MLEYSRTSSVGKYLHADLLEYIRINEEIFSNKIGKILDVNTGSLTVESDSFVASCYTEELVENYSAGTKISDNEYEFKHIVFTRHQLEDNTGCKLFFFPKGNDKYDIVAAVGKTDKGYAGFEESKKEYFAGSIDLKSKILELNMEN